MLMNYVIEWIMIFTLICSSTVSLDIWMIKILLEYVLVVMDRIPKSVVPHRQNSMDKEKTILLLKLVVLESANWLAETISTATINSKESLRLISVRQSAMLLLLYTLVDSRLVDVQNLTVICSSVSLAISLLTLPMLFVVRSILLLLIMPLKELFVRPKQLKMDLLLLPDQKRLNW